MAVELKPPPRGVWIALAGLGGSALVDVFSLVLAFEAYDFFQFMITGIFIYYVRRGHPLAHQWAVVLGFLAAMVAGIALVQIASTKLPAWVMGVVALKMLGLLTAAFTLSTQESRAWFDLRCPKCSSYKVKAASFLFNKLKCRSCKHAWNLRERVVDSSAFD